MCTCMAYEWLLTYMFALSYIASMLDIHKQCNHVHAYWNTIRCENIQIACQI